jgi:ammonia channel protein AmtB
MTAAFGSFNWYSYNSGSFVTHLSRAFLAADNTNIKKLAMMYPQMYAALLEVNRDKAPENFEPEYNAEERK